MKQSLKKDALSVCGGMYRMNAGYAAGYMFNSTDDGKKVYNGEFCCSSEIDSLSKEYDYYYCFKSAKFIINKSI